MQGAERLKRAQRSLGRIGRAAGGRTLPITPRAAALPLAARAAAAAASSGGAGSISEIVTTGSVRSDAAGLRPTAPASKDGY